MGEIIVEHDGSRIDFRPGLRVDKSLGGLDVLQFTVIVTEGGTAPIGRGDSVHCYIAREGQENVRDMQHVFGGTVEEVNDQDVSLGSGSTDVRYITYRCVDFSQLANRFLVTEQYEDMKLKAIIEDLVTKYLSDEDVFLWMPDDGPTIEEAVFPYTTVAEALDQLSELTGYAWDINYERTLEVFLREENESDLRITDNRQPYKSLMVSRSRQNLRNRQYIRAGTDVTDSRTEKFSGDGNTQGFTLIYPAHKEPTVKVNGVEKTVGIRDVEENFDWYWNKGDRVISQDAASDPLTASDTLEVTYQGQFPVVVQATDKGSVSDRQSVEGGTGIYEHVEDRPEIDSRNLALSVAGGLLGRFSDGLEEIEFELDLEADTSSYAYETWTDLQTVADSPEEVISSFEFSHIRTKVRQHQDQATGDVEIRVNEGDWHTVWSQQQGDRLQTQHLPIGGRKIEVRSLDAGMDVDIVMEGRPEDLKPGQLMHIELTGQQVSGDFLITDVEASDRGDFEADYTVRCIAGDQYGGWRKYFKDQLKERKRFVIRENEVLVVLRKHEDTLTLSDTATVDEHEGRYEIGSAQISFSLIEGLPQ